MTTEARAHTLRGSGIAFKAVAAFFSIAVLSAGAGFARDAYDPFLIENFNCADMAAHSIEKQVNLRADAIRDKCRGKGQAGVGQESGDLGEDGSPLSPDVYGGTDTNTHPSNSAAIQSESQSFRFGSTIVVTYNDLSGGSTGKGSFSTDGGVTFARIAGDPFGTGHGSNFGDPGIVYDPVRAKWVATFLASGCGGQGVGAWNSNDGMTWATAGCAANAGGGNGDRNALWADTNPASPFYGRIYNSYNDFGVGGGALMTTFSTDGGATWSAPNTVVGSFQRDIALAATPNGNVYLAGMDEGGGGAANRINYMHRSTDGGVTWLAQVATGPAFPPPGNVNCSGNAYFRVITPQIRHMGWGQPSGGAGNVIHYAYAQHGAATDEGDIYYVRSTDNGATWSVPLLMNSDVGGRAQWMPSVSTTAAGAVFVKWYDRRDTANNDYWIYGRASLDNGATWQTDQAVSDAVIPQPIVQTANCYMGDYDFWQGDGNATQGSWTDSRGAGSGGTQDVFHDSADVPVGITVTPAVQNVCQPNNAVYTVNLTTFFTSAVTLSSSGAPAGTTTGFAPNPVTPPGSSTFTISNTNLGAPGTYTVNVLGTAGAQNGNQNVTLNLFSAAPGAVTLTSPPNGAVNVSTGPTLTWAATPQALTYDIQVATDPGFTNIVAAATGLPGTSYTAAGLAPATLHYWRVRALNTCGTGSYAAAFTFTTLSTCVQGGNYTITPGAGAIVPGTTFIAGSNCDDCSVNVPLPFTVAFYDQTFSSVNVISNGNVEFVSADTAFTNACLPAAAKNFAILAQWDDLLNTAAGNGIYTSVTGVTPNQVFHIEWRAAYFSGGGSANFEVRLHEDTPNFEVIYGVVTQGGTSATIGVQHDTGSLFTQFSCNTGGITADEMLSFTCQIVPVELTHFGVE